MNGEEAKILARVETQVGKLAETVNRELVPTVTRVETKLDETAKRHGQEIKKLFEKVEQAGARLRDVELDYVPEDKHKAHVDENRDDHKEFRGGLEKQGAFGGTMKGGALVLAVIGGGFLAWLLDKFAGGEG